MALTMTRDEREAFLAEVHVAVLSVPEAGRGPLAVPVWYGYEPGGELWFVTDGRSRKGRLLRQGQRVSLCAQVEAAPYRYVTVEGPVTAIGRTDVDRDLRPLARRYLGAQGGDRFVESTGGAAARTESIVVRVRPERWLTADFGKRPAGSG
jgi:PPOX class probable F420-dependent enzyme